MNEGKGVLFLLKLVLLILAKGFWGCPPVVIAAGLGEVVLTAFDVFQVAIDFAGRDEIAGCSEKVYDYLSINNACQMLIVSTDKELYEYIVEVKVKEHPEWEVKNGSLFFQKVKESALSKEIPSLQLINHTLSYARELVRIV